MMASLTFPLGTNAVTEFQELTTVATILRDILFPIVEDSLYIETHADSNEVYELMISAFEAAITGHGAIAPHEEGEGA